MADVRLRYSVQNQHLPSHTPEFSACLSQRYRLITSPRKIRSRKWDIVDRSYVRWTYVLHRIRTKAVSMSIADKVIISSFYFASCGISSD